MDRSCDSQGAEATYGYFAYTEPFDSTPRISLDFVQDHGNKVEINSTFCGNASVKQRLDEPTVGIPENCGLADQKTPSISRPTQPQAPEPGYSSHLSQNHCPYEM